MESRNNTSTVLIDIVDITGVGSPDKETILSMPLEPNKRYKVEAWLGPIEGVPVNVSLMIGSQSRFTGRKIMNASGGSTDFAFDASSDIEGSFFGYGTDANANLAIEGILTTGLVSDVLKIKAGQETADTTTTVVPAGSYLIVTPLD